MARAGTNHKGGRPKGKKNAQTLEREKVAAALRDRILSLADGLLTKQLSLGVGQQFLYRIDTIQSGKGCMHCGVKKEFFDKKKCLEGKTHLETRLKSERKRPVLIESEPEIRKYIESLVNGEVENDATLLTSKYYFITAKAPDGNAIDSMLDRGIGRPVQATKLVDDEGKSVPITSINVVPLETSKKSK